MNNWENVQPESDELVPQTDWDSMLKRYEQERAKGILPPDSVPWRLALDLAEKDKTVISLIGIGLEGRRSAQ